MELSTIIINGGHPNWVNLKRTENPIFKPFINFKETIVNAVYNSQTIHELFSQRIRNEIFVVKYRLSISHDILVFYDSLLSQTPPIFMTSVGTYCIWGINEQKQWSRHIYPYPLSWQSRYNSSGLWNISDKGVSLFFLLFMHCFKSRLLSQSACETSKIWRRLWHWYGWSETIEDLNIACVNTERMNSIQWYNWAMFP